MTLEARLRVLEQRIRPEPTAPVREPFDYDAYEAALPLEELAARAAAVVDEPHAVGDFDYGAFARECYRLLAGSPPNWPELLAEAMGR